MNKPTARTTHDPLGLSPESLLILEEHRKTLLSRRQQTVVLQKLIESQDPNELMFRPSDVEGTAHKSERLGLVLEKQFGCSSRKASEDPLSVTALLDLIEQYGPLAGLIADPDLTEVMVTRRDLVYIEKAGKVSLTKVRFPTNDDIYIVMRNILWPQGRVLDAENPIADARLPDGSRVNCVVPPAAVDGPMLTIRKFNMDIMSCQSLIDAGTLTDQMARFLQFAVHCKRNIIIAGGTSSGKTTLLNILGNFIPSGDRLVTIEDSAELILLHRHLCRLETQPPDSQGRGGITTRQLFRNSLRMRPDRIVVGEVRGQEVLDMFQALTSGHAGSMTTIHANSPRELMNRLEMLINLANSSFTQTAIRQLIATSLHLVVQLQRYPDGKRRVVNISEITGLESAAINMSSLFEFQQRAVTTSGEVLGDYKSRGFRPRFFEEVMRLGYEIPDNLI